MDILKPFGLSVSSAFCASGGTFPATTAERFFEYLGYRRIGREETPKAIRNSREFSSLCPSTAIVMVKS